MQIITQFSKTLRRYIRSQERKLLASRQEGLMVQAIIQITVPIMDNGMVQISGPTTDHGMVQITVPTTDNGMFQITVPTTDNGITLVIIVWLNIKRQK